MRHFLASTAAFVLVLFCASQTRADLTYYSSAASFDAATTDLSTQLFATVAANLGVGYNGTTSINNPLDTTTNSGMLPGLTITASTNSGSDIFVGGPGVYSTPDYVVGVNYGGATLNLAFSPGVTAVSSYLLGEFSPSTFAVSIYSPSNVLLGTTTVDPVPNTGPGAFFGVTATAGQVIGLVTLTAPNGPYADIESVQFGSASTVIPEPSTLVLAGLGGLMVMGYALRRRRVVA